MTLSIRLGEEMEARLAQLAELTGRTKTYYIKEALAEKLDELEDLYIALQRAEKPGKMWTLEQIKNEEDLAN